MLTALLLAPHPRPPGLARVRGEYYVVFDNAMSIGHMDDRFGFRWVGHADVGHADQGHAG